MLNVSFKRFQRILERGLHHYHQQQYQYQDYTFPPQFPFNFKHKSLSNFSKSRLSLLFTLHNKQINQETIFIKPQDTKIKKLFFFLKTPFFRLFWVIWQVDPEVGWWWWWVKSNKEGRRHAEIGCVVLKKIWNSGKLLNLRWAGWKFLRFQKIGNSGNGEVEHTPTAWYRYSPLLLLLWE